MAVKVDAGRVEANPAGTRVCKMKKKADMKVALVAKKSLTAMNCANVQVLMKS